MKEEKENKKTEKRVKLNKMSYSKKLNKSIAADDAGS